jgi:hypothetical protein
MFVHFDSDKGAECDNCGATGTIMHMSVLHVDQTVSLCIVCFGVLAQAICHASKKLIPSPSPNGRSSRGRSEESCSDETNHRARRDIIGAVVMAAEVDAQSKLVRAGNRSPERSSTARRVR